MRIIDYKLWNLTSKTYRRILLFLRKIIMGLSVYRWELEISETNKTYNIRLFISKYKLSRIEDKWLHRECDKFINTNMDNEV